MITASFLPGNTPSDVAVRFSQIPNAAVGQLQSTMMREMIQLQRDVVTGKLSGQVLHHRTGHLIRSIIYDVSTNGDSVAGMVGVGREAPYGAVHEFGGTFTIPEHPVREHLRRNANGGRSVVRAHTVGSHSATFPQRSFLRSAFQERLDLMIQRIRETMEAAIA